MPVRASLHKEANASRAAIFAAHHELLDDPDLIEMTQSMINKGKSVEYGWQHACTMYAEQLEGLKNSLLVKLINSSVIDESKLRREGVGAIVPIKENLVHLLVGLNADQYATQMHTQIANS